MRNCGVKIDAGVVSARCPNVAGRALGPVRGEGADGVMSC